MTNHGHAASPTFQRLLKSNLPRTLYVASHYLSCCACCRHHLWLLAPSGACVLIHACTCLCFHVQEGGLLVEGRNPATYQARTVYSCTELTQFLVQHFVGCDSHDSLGVTAPMSATSVSPLPRTLDASLLAIAACTNLLIVACARVLVAASGARPSTTAQPATSITPWQRSFRKTSGAITLADSCAPPTPATGANERLRAFCRGPSSAYGTRARKFAFRACAVRPRRRWASARKFAIQDSEW